MRTIYVHLLICAGLSACSSWPDSGPGGGEAGGIIAESTYLTALTDKEQAGLLAQSEVLDAHVELMVVQGAERCVPAAVLQLQQQGLAVRRELAAGLLQDVTADLAVYQHLIRQVRQRFYVVRARTGCAQMMSQAPAVQTADSRPLTEFTLLFDLNSAVIGPGYQRHLQLIAELSNSCECQLEIVGHTDQHGEEGTNLELAARRASAVQQALTALGVNAVVRQAEGERAPLLKDAAGQVLNRRVELWLQPKSVNEPPARSTGLRINQWQDAGVLPSLEP